MSAQLKAMPCTSRDSLDEVLSPLRDLLRAERACVYRFVGDDDGYRLETLHWSGYSMPSPVRAAVANVIASAPHSPHSWDPQRIEPHRRNVAHLSRQCMDPESWQQLPIVRGVYRKVGLLPFDQTTALICDGKTFLGMVGGFREELFTAREVALLQALVPALRRWLQWRLRVGRLLMAGSALPAVLEAIAAAAYVVDDHGSVMFCNDAGQRALAADRRGVREVLSQCVREGCSNDRFAVTRVAEAGIPGMTLAIERAPASLIDAVLVRAGRVWTLTPRQLDVLRLLVQGHANRTISEWLGCSERTVEIHVSAILVRAGAESRTALVAKFWREV